MAVVLHPWQVLVAALAGWIGRQQDAVIEYLREENRVLGQQLGRLPDASIFPSSNCAALPDSRFTALECKCTARSGVLSTPFRPLSERNWCRDQSPSCSWKPRATSVSLRNRTFQIVGALQSSATRFRSRQCPRVFRSTSDDSRQRSHGYPTTSDA